jgi:hypothetical protein
MKLFTQATAFLSVIISFGYASLIVPDTSDLTSYDVLSVAGSTGMNWRPSGHLIINEDSGDNNVSISFATPCEGCAHPNVVGLVLKLRLRD